MTLDIARYVNIALEVFGSILLLIVIASLLVSDNKKSKLDKIYIMILICNIIILLSDSLAYALQGIGGLHINHIMNAANFNMYVFSYLLAATFIHYFVTYLSAKTKIPKKLSYLFFGICAVSIILVIVSQFNHMYYDIDTNNVYQRQHLFWLSQVFGLAGIIATAVLVFTYRKSLNKREFIFFLSYTVLPILALCIQVFTYGLALLNIALTLSVFAIYIGIQVDLSIRLKNAESANRAKSNFLAAMSHEIRTPMNAIIGIAQIELHKGNLPAESAISMEKIYISGNSLLGIINDILDMSKIEAGKMTLNPIEYDVPSLIHDAVQLNMVRIGSKPIELLLDADKNLPSRMYGDELRLKQILNNLLSNAIKYTEKGHVKLSINHLAQGEDILLRFIVEDTGQGLKPEDKEMLFSEYARFNLESNRTTEGTGIGLNITKSFIEMMDGRITVESEYGKGSVFTVTVKQKAVECETIGAELSEKMRNFMFLENRQLSKLQIVREYMPYGKVLIVDDAETNLYVAEGLLMPYGLKIETAVSGFEVLDKIYRGESYDIIFMDHMMPDMDGIETTRKLREANYKGVIVAFTANALTGNDAMFLQNGFDGFISKPIDMLQLNDCLNKFIRDRHPDAAAMQTVGEQPFKAGKLSKKLLQIFCRDAKKAIVTLQDTVTSGNIKLFTTTAHAMKSALANVGEVTASQQAAELERAGLEQDMDLIAAKTESFIQSLEMLINALMPPESESSTNAEPDEDNMHLIEQLRIIELACEDYELETAYAVLDLLKEKSWKKETQTTLESIREKLLLHSDFEGAAEQAIELSEKLSL